MQIADLPELAQNGSLRVLSGLLAVSAFRPARLVPTRSQTRPMGSAGGHAALGDAEIGVDTTKGPV